ncbi:MULTISPECIES: hypothetical protein [Streptomyces]|uniref:hypothetical protein n=1 Tax=Streptomyces TaxID=1883 RepID=UPI0004CBA525|nr:hypothetical protein [Streptomyces sp. NRRL F-5650]
MRKSTLPRHARTGQLAVGWRKPRPGEDGLQPIYPILGGAEDDDGGEDDDQDDDGGDDSDKDDNDDGDDEWAETLKQWKKEGLKPKQVAERLAASRKWEARAKKNSSAAEELAKLKREGMSETEAAVAAARAEERVKGGERIARSAFLAAAKGRIPDPKAVVEDINLRKYVDDDGEVDDDAISKLVDKLAPERSDTDDEDDDQDERDTRRRRRTGRGYQGARNGSGRSKDKRGSAADGVALYEELIGPRRGTANN